MPRLHKASAHSGNIAHIHHHAAIPGKPRHVFYKIFNEALYRKQKIAIAIRNGGTVVANGNEILATGCTDMRSRIERTKYIADINFVRKTTTSQQ
jgi:hypothetical protein